jgi:hypothetical protein
VQPPPDIADTELTFWQPWSRQLIDTIDQVRAVVVADSSDKAKRSQLDQLGAEVHDLLCQLDERTSPCGEFGAAIDALRLPLDAEPISLSDAIDRLRTLAAMTFRRSPTAVPPLGSRTRGRTRVVGDQQELPGLEPINEGATT